MHGCDEEYIGETGDTLHHRLTVHRQQIRDARVRILYVSNHIANCARFQPVKFTILPLYKMQTDCVSARKMKEKHFIGLLKPKLNKTFRILKSVNLFHNISTYYYIIILVTSLPVFNNVVVQLNAKYRYFNVKKVGNISQSILKAIQAFHTVCMVLYIEGSDPVMGASNLTYCLYLDPRLLVHYPRLLKFCVQLQTGAHRRK